MNALYVAVVVVEHNIRSFFLKKKKSDSTRVHSSYSYRVQLQLKLQLGHIALLTFERYGPFQNF